MSGARLPCSCACFALQQFALAFDTPAIARKLAVAAHHTVAGDGDGEVIGCASLSHCARGFRRADAFSDLCVADSGARRNLAQCLPHAFLKGGAAYIEGKAQAQRRCFDEPDDLRNQLLECCVPPNQPRLGELVLQVVHELFGIITQQNGADPPLALGDQDSAKRALPDREADLGVRPARAVVARPHSKQAVRGFVETAVRVEASTVDGIRDRCSCSTEFLAQFASTRSRRVGLRREPCFGLEDTMKMERAHARPCGELVQIGLHLLRLYLVTSPSDARCAWL